MVAQFRKFAKKKKKKIVELCISYGYILWYVK